MENVKSMVKAALVADALALGVHWINSPPEVAKRFKPGEGLMAPGADSYHKTAKKGDFTHYGDQMMILLRSVVERKTFDLDFFAANWQAAFKNYLGYFDHATKATLSNFANGKKVLEAGSDSTELGGVARFSPLFLVYEDNTENLLKWGQEQASMTHRSSYSMELSDFFACLVHHLLHKTSLQEALKEASKLTLKAPSLKNLYDKALTSVNGDSINVIGDFGRTCQADNLFPGIIHLVLKYHDKPQEALYQSILAGGDNACRSIMVGTIMGAYHGFEFINPLHWNGLNKKSEIETLLSQIK